MLFGGAALLAYLLGGVSLRLALAVTALFPVIGFSIAWRRLPTDGRARLVRQLRIGAIVGLFATVAYDITKYALGQLDESPLNPFEAIQVFGQLLAGESASLVTAYTVGALFHVLNGVCFAVAYLFLFGHLGVTTAIAWGLFLELFQLTLYPGWLNINLYSEFLQISAVSHVIYGLTLGLCCRAFWKPTLDVKSHNS